LKVSSVRGTARCGLFLKDEIRPKAGPPTGQARPDQGPGSCSTATVKVRLSDIPVIS
jgi:hypothetical protein